MAVKIKCGAETNFYINRNNITDAYFNDIRNFPLLEADEERELLTELKTSKNEKVRERAKRKLLESNLKFVVTIAKKLGTPDTFMDLVSEGNMGLLKAIEKYDLNNNKCRLISYAVNWIAAYINHYITLNGKAVVPPNAIKLVTYVKRAENELFQKYERKPTAQEIAEVVKNKFKFNIPNMEDVELGRMISIEERFSVNNEESKFEESDIYNIRTSSNNVQDAIDDDHKKHQVERLLGKLSERERYIVKCHYGIGCDNESFDSISMRLDIGKERIRQICKGAVAKLKKEYDLK